MIRIFLLGASALMLGACVTGPVEKTFERAAVRAPENILGEAGKAINEAAFEAEVDAFQNRRRPQYPPGQLSALTAAVPSGVKLPLIVYSHGCAGIVRSSIGHLRWLAKLDDFAVIAPDSFARDRPEYCFRDFTVNVALSGEIRAMRQHEMEHAMAQIAKLPWVDRSNIFLMGHSQGGAVVSSYSGPLKVRGRILLNGFCSDTWGDGMNDDEALLTFDTGKDFWFRNYPTSCRSYALSRPRGKSVFKADSASHDLVLEHWPTVKAFLAQNRR